MSTTNEAPSASSASSSADAPIIVPAPLTQEQVMARIAQTARFSRTLADVAPLVPEKEDPTVLFRNNFLARGQGIEIVSSSGVGKSSVTMQAAVHWAAGKPFLAQPMKPLKVAIIQAEDSERDVAEQIEGMRRGLTEQEGWTEEDFDRVKRLVLCPTCFVGQQGDAFIAMLRDFQNSQRCDMIFVNPVQSFFGGDISSQEDTSRFLRGGIDPIIKDTAHNGENACGICIVMHTTKFSSGNKEGRANVDDYGEYIGGGSHEWLDWTRAKFVFLKHGKSDEYFDFKAAKRGKRLGWKKADGGFTTNKIYKHSEGFIYWEEVTNAEEVDGLKNGGTPSVSEEEIESVASRMVEKLRNCGTAVMKSELAESQIMQDIAPRYKLRLAKNRILADPDRWRLTIRTALIGRRYATFIGFAEGIRNAVKQCEQKERIEETKRPPEKPSVRPRHPAADPKPPVTPAPTAPTIATNDTQTDTDSYTDNEYYPF